MIHTIYLKNIYKKCSFTSHTYEGVWKRLPTAWNWRGSCRRRRGGSACWRSVTGGGWTVRLSYRMRCRLRKNTSFWTTAEQFTLWTKNHQISFERVSVIETIVWIRVTVHRRQFSNEKCLQAKHLSSFRFNCNDNNKCTWFYMAPHSKKNPQIVNNQKMLLTFY